MREALDPEAVQALYAETPDRFTAARNELAEQLSKAGDTDAAKQVTKLRKPTLSAWAIDRLARDHAPELEALIEAGKDLASAQRELAAGGSVDRLSEAASERRRLVDQLVRASAGALDNAGLSATRGTLDKVMDTLMAIATDQEAAERVRRGVLDRELPAPAGFGDERFDKPLLASVSVLTTRASDDSGSRDATTTQRAKARADRLTAEAVKLEQDAMRLEREAKEAKKLAISTARSAAAARRRAETARRRAEKETD